MLLSEAWKKYQQDKKIEGYSTLTLKTYCFQYNLLLRFFGDIDMNGFSTEKLKEYLLQSGNHLKPSSLGHRIRCVKSLNVTTGEYIPPKNLLGILMYFQIAFAETDEGVPFLISNGKCPDSQNLEPVSSDKGLLNALNTIIPEVYKNQNYKGWKVETIAHLSESPHPDAYMQWLKIIVEKKLLTILGL